MKIFGSFVNLKGRIVEVTMVSDKPGTDIEIGDGVLDFQGEDAITTECGNSDSMDVAQMHGATIKLLASRYMPELYGLSCHDVSVNISLDGNNVFAGWIEPNVYSQPFNEAQDEMELSCVDWLSATQYTNFKKIGTPGVSYISIKQSSGLHTFKELLKEALDDATDGNAYAVYYDGSKSLSDGSPNNIFDSLKVSDLVWLGDDEDDVKTYQNVVEETLRYLDLHIVQYGKAFYIYSWETLRKGNPTWTLLFGDSSIAAILSSSTIILTTDNVEDDGAQIEIGDTYNKFMLKVSPKKIENLLESPLDQDSMYPATNRRQVYCTVVSSEGEGSKAHKSFIDYILNENAALYKYDELTAKDYLFRAMRSENWRFGNDLNGNGRDWAENLGENGYQEKVPNTFPKEIGCSIIAIKDVDLKANGKDDSNTATVSLDDMLVVSVNGNEDDSESGRYPNSAALLTACPVAVYTGGGNSSVFSPSDPDSCNYIVISGKIILNPIMKQSHVTMVDSNGKIVDEDISNASRLRDLLNGRHITADNYNAITDRINTVPSRSNGDGRLFAIDWYESNELSMGSLGNAGRKGVMPSPNPQGTSGGYSSGWIPYTGDGPEEYEYKEKGGTDKVSKVDVLACMLRIGDKVLVEDMTGDGSMQYLSWQPYRTLKECGNDKNLYYEQSFAIGFNPKIGDKIIGDEYSIATNFDWTMGISAGEGMAIPMPYDSGLAGDVHFEILGPADEWWNNNIRRHKTWFRSEKWSTEAVPLLSHVSSIIVKDFEMKIYSNIQADKDESDIIYQSKTDEKFYRKKDDLEFAIHSGFTTAECEAYGLSSSVAVTTVQTGNKAVLSVKDNNLGVSAKPEKLYVNAYYNELHEPRIILNQNLQDKGNIVMPFGKYTHKALGKTFIVQSLGLNLMEGSAQMRLEESF